MAKNSDCPIEPLADRVVAVRVDGASQTKSGLYLPDSAKEKSQIAVVKAVGKDVKEVAREDQIVVREYAMTEVKVDGKTYLIAKEEDILAKIAK